MDRTPADLAALREAFGDKPHGPPLGWDAVRAFEAEHGITLPEPYRTFVAEICDGAPSGPPHYLSYTVTDLKILTGPDAPAG